MGIITAGSAFFASTFSMSGVSDPRAPTSTKSRHPASYIASIIRSKLSGAIICSTNPLTTEEVECPMGAPVTHE